ncbi:TCR/Tet family MFS transporter [Rhizobium glycinendophyticum]|uniref:TCR/Tet family MFS transporter n=1 Tax=Rhizobium glycinendophyticum TaxID=2589807 RepID=A0A504UUC5_9HYPH|nr:TCR/Tet family MFS transporter [Rhizobium glycinendophyticum]TPP10331.1 TCR/Tet family MFS transporter [Rhizobium glycinendophyticum]
MTRPFTLILMTVVLDAIGIGLIFPILPALLRDVTHVGDVTPYIGIMMALYAAMQFLFAPLLGALSDSFGRRPVLLISLAGSMLNYFFLALAPSLWLLLLGRALAGLTSANTSVAAAYITDLTAQDQRARRFGLMNAMFGIGFIIGPVLGGLLGDHWVRLPFLAAAVLTGANLLFCLFVLPETRTQGHQVTDIGALNPLRPFRWLFTMKGVLPLVLIFFLFSGLGEAYGTCWALWGNDVFHWNGLWLGLSLGAYGTCQTLAQAFLPGPATQRLGERPAILVGIASACAALGLFAVASEGWLVFAAMPILALGGIGVPALQSLATRQVSEADQGKFQGLLQSTVSLASVVAPLGFSNLYLLARPVWPGAIWLSVATLYGVGALLILRLRFDEPQAEI